MVVVSELYAFCLFCICWFCLGVLKERDIILLCSFCWLVGLKLSISASAFQMLKLKVYINTAEFFVAIIPFFNQEFFYYDLFIDSFIPDCICRVWS